MVSPRPRHAVPVPLPVPSTALRRVLGAKILLTLGLWAGPALVFPAAWFPVIGIPEPPLAHLVFLRLLGASYLALVAGYALAWRTPARHPGAILVGIISNALAALVILSVGSAGGFMSWSVLGAAYIWGSGVIAATLAVALALTGRPLLRKIAERPRAVPPRGGASVKVV
jgi:hypothetical protein